MLFWYEQLPDEASDLLTDHLCAQPIWARVRYHSFAFHLVSIGEKGPDVECPHVDQGPPTLPHTQTRYRPDRVCRDSNVVVLGDGYTFSFSRYLLL